MITQQKLNDFKEKDSLRKQDEKLILEQDSK